MSKQIAWLLLLGSFAVHAEMYKCKGPDGKLQLTDRPCAAGSQSETVKDKGSYVSDQDRYAAQVRAARAKGELDQKDYEKAVEVDNYNREQQRADAARKAAQAAQVQQSSGNYQKASEECVKDVERRGGSQDDKARMMSACQTAGSTQRSLGVSQDMVTACVKNVERSAASEAVKTREIAKCHGGDVPPIPMDKPQQKAVPTTITRCDSHMCWDNTGTAYTRNGDFLTSPTGKNCHIVGNMATCN